MSHRILIVEDRASQASAFARTLSAHGYQVRVAGDGRAGVGIALDWLPDAILMDVRLPVMNGLVACARIRNHPRTRNVPVIAVTARSRPEDFVHGLLAGFNKYLTKPCSTQELLAVVAELLRRAEERAKLEALAPARRELDALLRVVGGREQIFAGLLAALRGPVGCDLLALHWRAGDATNLLVTTRFRAPPAALLDQVTGAMAALAGPAPTATLVIDGHDPLPPGARLRAAFEVPLGHGSDYLGVLYVASASRDQFTAAEQEAVIALSPAVTRVCASGLDIEPEADSDAHALVHEIDVLVVHDQAALAAAWAARVEAAVPGVRVRVAAALPEPVAGEPDYHLVLVAPALRDRTEHDMFVRARTGAPTAPLLDLGPVELDAGDRDLPALLFMQLLIGFMDARRSGCLHVLTGDGSRPPGLIVFHDGRIAWARGPRDETSLAGLLRQAGAGRDAVRAAVAASVRDHRPITEVLVRDGLVARDTLRAALKDHIVAAVGENLRVERPRLLVSRQVVATPDNESFAVDDITIEMFSP